ncbi:MAG: glutamate-cysteine ligase family protein [Gammaproteobacteria bacterium]|nr:glutamate-cysteine ligase family protein [Gammaproteobacteria bacterium]
MGQEINKRRFDNSDFDLFAIKLKNETELLRQWFAESRFESDKLMAGLELEACLVDSNFRPAAVNETFFETADSDYLTPELAKFNIELNVDALPLNTGVLTGLRQSLQQHWHNCRRAAQLMATDVIAVGILPTLTDADLSTENMSKMVRYEALNEQVLSKRKGKPLRLNIVGKENLQSLHYDVMLESAATSLQIHLQVPQEKAVAYYNASVFVSAFTVAAAANSPFLFGKSLWEESRIPLFEQAVESGGFDAAANGPLHRVSFGSDYCRQSLMECFDENLKHFPVLLPMNFATAPQALQHLRLHNGTIWRWNRPIIGFNDKHEPHLRIEHRVMPAGPTITDQLANIALYYGLVNYFAEQDTVKSEMKAFSTAKDNFYNAARFGLKASVKWSDGNSYSLQKLFKEVLLDYAALGLRKLGVDKKDSDFYLHVIKQRVASGRTGSNWQQMFVRRYGKDMRLMTQQYFIRQNSDKAVHQWDWSIIDAE